MLNQRHTTPGLSTRLGQPKLTLTNCRPNKEGKKPRPAWKCTCPPAPPPSVPDTPPPNPPHPPPVPRPPTEAFKGLGRSAGGRSASGRLGTLGRSVGFVLPAEKASGGVGKAAGTSLLRFISGRRERCVSIIQTVHALTRPAPGINVVCSTPKKGNDIPS